jgi:L-threonylcarbamoyladenylate synthase
MTINTTPILPCSNASIEISPSPSPLHRLQSPTFSATSAITRHLDEASSHLRDGRTVAVPTETVYGLAGSSLNPDAVKLIYTIKNRPSDNPLIIHVSSLNMLQRLLPASYAISKLYLALIDAFWPGPLTLLFPSINPPAPPAPQTNAIRMPNHPLALALIDHCDLPLSAPSANSSGRPSPTRAQHVFNDLNGKEGLGCILDGGDCGVGVESTVVDGLSWKEGGGGYVDILRPGGLGVEEIARIVEEVDGGEQTEIRVHGRPWSRNAVASSSRMPILPAQNGMPPSTPGLKYRHYSPRVPVYLLLPSNTFPRPDNPASADHTPLAAIRHVLSAVQRGKRPRLGLLHYDESPLARRLLDDVDNVDIESISLGPDSASAAQRLFSGMLSLEGPRPTHEGPDGIYQVGVDAILIEGCSDEGLGLAVMERAGKAVGGGGRSGSLGNGEGEGSEGRIWVQV